MLLLFDGQRFACECSRNMNNPWETLFVYAQQFAACTPEELINAPDVLSIFFTKVFGASPHSRTASGILLALSSAGNVMSTTFAAVRG